VECREVFIRQYFDETDAEPCGHCDRCLNRGKHDLQWSKAIYKVLDDRNGITIKDFLGQYNTEHHPGIKKELQQLAEEHKIQIVDDKIFKEVK
jgi:superfamily II DNA helicase RecQ